MRLPTAAEVLYYAKMEKSDDAIEVLETALARAYDRQPKDKPNGSTVKRGRKAKRVIPDVDIDPNWTSARVTEV